VTSNRRNTHDRWHEDDRPPLRDLAKAKAVYRELLGLEPYADEPYYVGFRVGDQELGLDPNGHGKG